MKARSILACLTLLAGVASAEDKERSPKENHPPFNPFADALMGDWAANLRTGGGVTPPGREETFRVEDATDDKVNVATWEHRSGESQTHSDLTRPRRGVPNATQSFPPFLPVEGLTVEKTGQQEHTVDGREFNCTRVTLVTEGRMVTLWLSPEVRLQGLVEAVEEVGGREELRLRLIGYGRGEKAEWGKGPEEPLPPLKR